MITADNLAFPPTLNLQDAEGKTVVATYSGADALYDKLSTKPIATGEMVRGVLLFGISGVSYEVLISPGTQYRLKLTDVTGTEAHGDLVWPVKPSDVFGYIPGLSSSSATCPPLPKTNAN
jgi:hypothetical protein